MNSLLPAFCPIKAAIPSLAHASIARILETPSVLAPLLTIERVPERKVRLRFDPSRVSFVFVSNMYCCSAGIFVNDATVSQGMKSPSKYRVSPAGRGDPPRTICPKSPKGTSSQSSGIVPTSVCLYPCFSTMKPPSTVDGSRPEPAEQSPRPRVRAEALRSVRPACAPAPSGSAIRERPHLAHRHPAAPAIWR